MASASGNTVKLVFAGDATSLERAAKAANSSLDGFNKHAKTAESNSQGMAHGLKDVGAQAKSTKTALRGAGEATALFGGQLGQSALMAGMALGAVKDMTKGLAGMVPQLKASAAGLGVLRIGFITAGAALLAWAAQQEHASQGSSSFFHKMAADANFAAATNVHFVTQGVPLLGRLTGAWRDSADGISQAAHSMVDSANAAADALNRLNNLKRINGTFGIPDANPGGDAFVDQSALDMMELRPGVLRQQYLDSLPRAAAATGGAVKAVMTAAEKAFKDGLQKLKDLKSDMKDAVAGIMDSLAPRLVPGASGDVTNGLLDQLNKTKQLYAGLKALAKQGLNKDELHRLTMGGLDSLGAVNGLLAGGKSTVAWVNQAETSINNVSGKIASADAMRQYGGKVERQEVKLKIDVTGGQDDLVKLLRKWVRTNGGGNVQKAFGA